MTRRAPPCLLQGYISLLHGTVGLMTIRRLYLFVQSPFCYSIFLVFFTKRLDKSRFFLYNDAVMELSVVQETLGFRIYILFSAYAEQGASEEYG